MKNWGNVAHLRRHLAISALVVTVAVGAASSAQAGIDHWYDIKTSVSCDGNTIKNAGSIDHYNSQIPWANGINATQHNATTNSSTTKVFLRSPSGNDTSTKSLSNGSSASWTNVQAAVYSVMAYRGSAANCNGALPGHGNYTWSSTIEVGAW